MEQGQDSVGPTSVEEQLKKIEAQIDKAIFIHQNPKQIKEIEKTLSLPSKDPAKILRRCIKRMEEINSRLNGSEHGTTSILSIKEQLEHLYQRRKGSFDDSKCYGLLVRNRNISIALPSKKRKAIKSKGKTLSYEFREKLTGFLPKRGRILWNDERIDEFIRSMMS